jgi:two-component sensor histidine kinase
MLDWLPALRPNNLCYVTDPSAFWIRNVSDLMIGGAYALIPFGLASFLSERRDVEFGWLAWLFALFIALCGATHWMHIWLEFFPHFTAEAYLKAATAVASMGTAGAVIALLPEIKRLPTPAMMEREHRRRIDAEVALREALEERSNDEFKRHIETQDLLINELNHRVKNTLTTVQAMAALSFRDVDPASRPGLDAFQGRLFALSVAHNLLNQESWTGASLIQLVRTEIQFATDVERAHLSGPEVRLSARETVSLALVVHELVTNSIKHGGLRLEVPGSVNVLWELAEGRLKLVWQDRTVGGRVEPPSAEGFGLKMIRRTIERELQGRLTMDWQSEGLRVDMSVPLERGAEGTVSQR